MYRLLLGLALLLTAAWLGRADDKSAAGLEKLGRTHVEWRNIYGSQGPDDALAQFIMVRPLDSLSSFEFGSSSFSQSGLLGPVFDYGPPSTGARLGINGVTLKFVPAER